MPLMREDVLYPVVHKRIQAMNATEYCQQQLHQEQAILARRQVDCSVNTRSGKQRKHAGHTTNIAVSVRDRKILGLSYRINTQKIRT